MLKSRNIAGVLTAATVIGAVPAGIVPEYICRKESLGFLVIESDLVEEWTTSKWIDFTVEVNAIDSIVLQSRL